MTQNTWKAVGLLLLAGMAGAGVGAGAMAGMHQKGHPERGRRGSDWYVEMLARELDLSPTQQDSVRAVLDRHRPGMDSIWAEMNPRMRAWREGLRAAVRAQLTPDQQARYAQLTARLDAEREQRSNPDSTKR